MFAERQQFKSSYGTFAARERELERSRARRDDHDATRDGGHPAGPSAPAAERPSP